MISKKNNLYFYISQKWCLLYKQQRKINIETKKEIQLIKINKTSLNKCIFLHFNILRRCMYLESILNVYINVSSVFQSKFK